MRPRVSGKLPVRLRSAPSTRSSVVPVSRLLRAFLLGACGVVAAIYALYRYYSRPPVATSPAPAPSSSEWTIDLEPAPSK